LPEVERVRRTLAPAMAGARFDGVQLNRRDLRQPFPTGFARRLKGQSVRALVRRGKYLLGELSSGDTLVMHLGMSGWFRVEKSKRSTARRNRETDLDNRHDHVVFTMSSGMTVTFNDPRRFGIMDLITADRLARHASLGRLGPEPLSRAFDDRALAERLAKRRISLKAALLDQHVVAGIGNIYASEALHLAGLSPFRLASSLVTRAGAPRGGCERLVQAIKSVLRRAIVLKESERYRGSRFRVYDRDGERCATAGCPGTIARAWQNGRSTFYCPVCQR
ncbi:MAG TPA: bifunctional DNA-formamidopyrimidine glycosylase/DNA-(apurinic or apyrimidinic site) lyase, partial [Vicinamibacterales bacterium]|nr:bifunctional DNA-formamidopyrimidine glycosylase/DNA-(apurinic or apyrimidinic site) lyase [Vicinamibacterales bacterium]